MTEETIFAVYDTVALADAAVRDLEAAGVPSSAISRHTRTSMTNDASATGAPVQEKGEIEIYSSTEFKTRDDPFNFRLALC